MSNININFYTKRRQGSETPLDTIVPIHCEVNYLVNGKFLRVRFSTGEKCKNRHFKNQRVYHTVNHATQINQKLEELRSQAIKVYRDALETGKMPAPAKFKEMILGKVYHVVQERDLLTDLESFIEYHKTKGSSRGVISHIKTLQEHLHCFARRRSFAITYETMNLDFYSQFVKFLKGVEYRKGSTYTINTIGCLIKHLKMFLNWSKSMGWNKYDYFQHAEFKVLTEPVENIYLEENELELIEALDLRHRPGLANVRNWFLIACDTAMRYSDYYQLHRENIKEVPNGYDYTYFPNKTSKTSKHKVTVPLSNRVMRILTRYGLEMPKPISNTKMNEALKKIALLAGIPKSIGTHTARRTFATLSYKDGQSIQDIMKITGHRTEREFYKYLCIDGEENASLLRQRNSKYQIKKAGLLESLLKVS
jgi:integrase